MQIRAECCFDLAMIETLTHYNRFKQNDPKKRMQLYLIWDALLLLAITLEIVFLGVSAVLIILAVCAVLHSACLLFGHYILPKRRFRKLHVMQNGYNRYVFSEDCVQIHSFGRDYTSQQEIKLDLVTSIAETNRYLIIFCHSMRLALPVDKSTIEGTSAKDLVQLLTNHGQKRYTRCKY